MVGEVMVTSESKTSAEEGTTAPSSNTKNSDIPVSPSDVEEDVIRLISIHDKYRKTGNDYN
jgi:hypothetical protein